MKLTLRLAITEGKVLTRNMGKQFKIYSWKKPHKDLQKRIINDPSIPVSLEWQVPTIEMNLDCQREELKFSLLS